MRLTTKLGIILTLRCNSGARYLARSDLSSGSRIFARAVVTAALLLAVCGPTQSAEKPSKTLGFVITTWDTAIVETQFGDECPEGFATGNDELWWRGLPKQDRARLTDNGKRGFSERFGIATNRGPNKENVCLNPTVVVDPPHKIVEGATSFGMNMDGTTDGKTTPKSCQHQKFTGVDGTPAVDNQMYRLLGCTYGWHFYGQYQDNANVNRKTTGFGINIIEVTGVDDPRNDPDVTVNWYHAVDQYALNAQGDFTPFASYRIETREGKSPYGAPAKGKIVDGVLETQAADMTLPFYGNYTWMDQKYRDLKLRLKISPDGKSAKGMAAAYYDVDQLMYYITGLGVVSYSAQSNCPSLYVAAHQLADGYPDPKTGECTALSAAYNFDAVAAFAIHPDAAATKQADAGPIKRVLTALGIGE